MTGTVYSEVPRMPNAKSNLAKEVAEAQLHTLSDALARLRYGPLKKDTHLWLGVFWTSAIISAFILLNPTLSPDKYGVLDPFSYLILLCSIFALSMSNGHIIMNRVMKTDITRNRKPLDDHPGMEIRLPLNQKVLRIVQNFTKQTGINVQFMHSPDTLAQYVKERNLLLLDIEWIIDAQAIEFPFTAYSPDFDFDFLDTLSDMASLNTHLLQQLNKLTEKLSRAGGQEGLSFQHFQSNKNLQNPFALAHRLKKVSEKNQTGEMYRLLDHFLATLEHGLSFVLLPELLLKRTLGKNKLTKAGIKPSEILYQTLLQDAEGTLSLSAKPMQQADWERLPKSIQSSA